MHHPTICLLYRRVVSIGTGVPCHDVYNYWRTAPLTRLDSTIAQKGNSLLLATEDAQDLGARVVADRFSGFSGSQEVRCIATTTAIQARTRLSKSWDKTEFYGPFFKEGTFDRAQTIEAARNTVCRNRNESVIDRRSNGRPYAADGDRGEGEPHS
jgi:hypothetical protein